MAATERITIYVTKADKRRIYALAKIGGKSASEFARDTVLAITKIASDVNNAAKHSLPSP